MQKTDIALLGECMLELSPAGEPRQYRLGVAGDTYNTAAGLAQLGFQVEYLTGLGRDRHSELILKHMDGLGVGRHWLSLREDLLPGLYLIDNDDAGERFFSYWRWDSAAHRTLSEPEALLALLDRARSCPRLMLSGITLALCGPAGRATLLDWVGEYRKQGGQLIYDGNYRPALWNDTEEAGTAHRELLERVDIYLPGMEDELALRSLGQPSEVLDALQVSACHEIVLKDGPGSVQLWEGGNHSSVVTETVAEVIDTTGAGDSFNGGYLAARMAGWAIADAARLACETAARTIRYRGAILPQDQWKALREQLGSRKEK